MKILFPKTLHFTTIICFFGLACSSLNAQKPNPKAAKKNFDKALIEARKGNSGKALGLLKKAIKADKNYADAWGLQAEIAEKLGDTGLASASYKGNIAADPLYQPTYYYFANFLYKQKRYAESKALLEKFFNIPAEKGFKKSSDGASEVMNSKAKKLIESCSLAIEDNQIIEELDLKNLGPGVNTPAYEYWPGMTVDGETLIFTRLVDMQEDFYLSSRNNLSNWDKARPLPGNINTKENEGTTSISGNGKFIFFTVCNQEGFGSCDIFYSRTNGALWSRRINLGETINSAQWDAQPAISADAKTLIFSSARSGGYGGKDLWMSKWNEGKWSTPVNLGPKINTEGDEEAPFLHYDGRTLYFGSNGHPGYGEHDIFFSQLQPDKSWSKPVNLGKGINSDADEMGLYVDFKGERAYFASSRPGGYGGLDIYSFKLAGGMKPDPVTYVQGQVFDAETTAELSGRIDIYNLESNKQYYTDSSSSFFLTMQPNGNYSLNIKRQGYLFYSENFQPTESSVDSPFLVKAYLKPIKTDESLVLRNIFFETDKFDLRPESFTELNQVLELLNRNIGINIEISGHTDNQGGEDHNLKLSLNRANAVKNYLTSKGIDTKRIRTAGYGAKLPIGDNNTIAGRALNRRIEMKIISSTDKTTK